MRIYWYNQGDTIGSGNRNNHSYGKIVRYTLGVKDLLETTENLHTNPPLPKTA